jgi:hypothetical protein
MRIGLFGQSCAEPAEAVCLTGRAGYKANQRGGNGNLQWWGHGDAPSRFMNYAAIIHQLNSAVMWHVVGT